GMGKRVMHRNGSAHGVSDERRLFESALPEERAEYADEEPHRIARVRCGGAAEPWQIERYGPSARSDGQEVAAPVPECARETMQEDDRPTAAALEARDREAPLARRFDLGSYRNERFWGDEVRYAQLHQSR